MASRDLTNAYIDRRTTALKRRNALGSPTSNGLGGASLNGNKKRTNRLTAGGSDDHSLMLMEVSGSFGFVFLRGVPVVFLNHVCC